MAEMRGQPPIPGTRGAGEMSPIVVGPVPSLGSAQNQSLPPGANPLQQQHCDCLNQVLQSIPQALALVKACKDCGLDVSEFEDTFTQQLAMAQKMKATFFPGAP